METAGSVGGDRCYPEPARRDLAATVSAAVSITAATTLALFLIVINGVTLLLAADIHPKTVQEQLGHSTISMTLALYSHAAPHMQRQAAAKLDHVLSDTNRVA